jgi:hypothetical protein
MDYRIVAWGRTAPATPVLFRCESDYGVERGAYRGGNEAAAEVVCGLVRLALVKWGIRQALERVQSDLPDGVGEFW